MGNSLVLPVMLSLADVLIPGEPSRRLVFPCDIEYWPIPQVNTAGRPWLHYIRVPRGEHDVPLRYLTDGIIERRLRQAAVAAPLPVSSDDDGYVEGSIAWEDIKALPPAPAPPPEPAPKPPLESVVTVGELIGWRVWRVKKGHLQSFGVDTFWAPGAPMTAVRVEDTGMTGVWAFKERRLALDKLLEEARYQIMAYGAVALWGVVVEHELGYRAQFAKLLSLDELTGKERGSGLERKQQYRLRRQRLSQLRRRYGVKDFAAVTQTMPANVLSSKDN